MYKSIKRVDCDITSPSTKAYKVDNSMTPGFMDELMKALQAGGYNAAPSRLKQEAYDGHCTVCGAPNEAECTESCNDSSVPNDQVIKWKPKADLACECGQAKLGYARGKQHSSWCDWSKCD